MCLCVSLVASFTFYIANPVPELTTPIGSEDNIISFVSLDSSDPDLQISGMGLELEDKLGELTVSVVTSEGFELSWEPKTHVVYDSYILECRDTLGLWDVKEVHLHGDAKGSRFQGLRESTEYRVKLYGVSNSQRSSPLEAVTVTGICFTFGLHAFSTIDIPLLLNVAHFNSTWIAKSGFEQKS